MSDRRWGVAILALAMMAALVVPRLAGQSVEGTATRVPIPGPPQVGACLVGPSGDALSAYAYVGLTVFAPLLGPCADRNYGEVVAVTAVAARFPTTVVNRTSTPEVQACMPLAVAYFGLQVGDPNSSLLPESRLGSWRAVVAATVALIGPDLSQYFVGQTWIACVVLPSAGPYAGSARVGPVANVDPYAMCLTPSRYPDDEPVPCDAPHSGEVLAEITIETDQLPAALDSCRRLAGRLTGMTDTTAGGALATSVEVGEPYSDRWGGGYAADSATKLGRCTVTVVGDRRLGGSLIGIGDRPLPWV